VLTIVFTIEAVLRIVSLGFIAGPDSYLRIPWNVLDFVVVVSAWFYIFMDTTGVRTTIVKPNVLRCVRLFRPIRSIRFFIGLKQILESLLGGWVLLLEVCGFMMFFFCIFAAMGISLFAGALTHRCEDPFLRQFLESGAAGTCLNNVSGTTTPENCSFPQFFDGSIDRIPAYQVMRKAEGVELQRCPDHVASHCGFCGGSDAADSEYFEQGGFSRSNTECCRVVTERNVAAYGLSYSSEMYADRRDQVNYYGFNGVGMAMLTNFVVATMDEWPALSHPITNSNTSTSWLAWPFFAIMTLALAIMTANLFVSVVCYCFGSISNDLYLTAVDQAEIARLRVMFNRYDTDHSGQITAEEISKMAQVLGVSLSKAELAVAMESIDTIDTNDSQLVDFEEFSNWWRSPNELAIRMKRSLAQEEHRLRHAFESVDIDGTGIIHKEEVEGMGMALGVSLTTEEAASLMADMDKDASGEISFDEFVAWWFADSKLAQKIKAFTSGETARIRAIYDQCRDVSMRKITFASLQVLGPNLQMQFTKQELQSAFTEMDDTKSGRVNVDSFTHWFKSESPVAIKIRKQIAVQESEVRSLFSLIDNDGSGSITRDNIAEVAAKINFKLDEAGLQGLMSELDEDNSGAVDMDEFILWWTGSSEIALKFKETLQPYLIREAQPQFPFIPGLSPVCRALVIHPAAEWIVMVMVVTNAVFMATEHHDQSDEWTDTLVVIEIVFTILYTVEATLKIFGLGFKPYWNKFYNKMDLVIVLGSWLGILWPTLHGVAGLRGLRVLFRLLRIMRVMRLLSGSDTVKMLLRTVFGAWQMVANLSVLIIFMIVILSVVGMHTLGPCHLNDFGDDASLQSMFHADDATQHFELREHYFVFSRAALTTFQVMTGEDWAPVMYKYMQCAGPGTAVPYFVFVFACGNFFLLNLFVAVILVNFEIAEEEKLIKQEAKYLRELEQSQKTDSEKNSALMWLRDRRSRKDPDKFAAMQATRAAITRSHGLHLNTIGDGSDWNITEAHGLHFKNETVALGCLNQDNALRLKCTQMADSSNFETFVLFVIALSSIVLAMDEPHGAGGVHNTSWSDPLALINVLITVFFLAEFIIKIIAHGFMFTPRGYIMDPWNRLDLFVLVLACIDTIMLLAGSEPTSWTRVLRLLRILRPLRLIKHSQGVRVIVGALIASAPMVLAVLILNVVFYVVFATLGVTMFKGQFYSCNGPLDSLLPDLDANGTVISVIHIDGCDSCAGCEGCEREGTPAMLTSELGKQDCQRLGGEWKNPPYNFDNIFEAFKTLFICSTLEGWIDIMHAAMDVTGVGNAPIKDVQFGNFVFFWLFVVLAAFFTANVFVGVMVDFFKQTSGTGLLTESQKMWQLKQIMIMSVKSKTAVAPEDGLRLTVYTFVTGQCFEIFTLICILINVGFLLAEEFPMDRDTRDTFVMINVVFLVLFTIEALIKIYALGINQYTTDHWNKVDFFVVLICWMTELLGELPFLSALRSLRVCRLIMLLRFAPSLKSLFGTLLLSLPPCFNLATLLSVVYFMWGIVGVQFYGNLPWGSAEFRSERCAHPFASSGGQIGPRECWYPAEWSQEGFLNKNDNFDNVWNAFRLLFQISTGQDWANLMDEIRQRLDDLEPSQGTLHAVGVFSYFCTFYVATAFVFLNLFVAVLLENFEMNFEAHMLDLKEDHIEEFREVWVEHTSNQDESTVGISDLQSIIDGLQKRGNPLGDLAADSNWKNRLLFELDVGADHVDARVGFHQVLLGITLLLHTYDGLSYEDMRFKLERIQRRTEMHSARILTAFLRSNVAHKNIPDVDVYGRPLDTDSRKQAYRAGVDMCRLMVVDAAVRTNKLALQTEAISLQHLTSPRESIRASVASPRESIRASLASPSALV
jgi:Ca2+-binding EF-hand superfamily protein